MCLQYITGCVVGQSLLIDRAGRKMLMGYGYLLMGVIMSILIVMLSIKVTNRSNPQGFSG